MNEADTAPVGEVTLRELRCHSGHVLDRVAAGARVTITRHGKPVARLEPAAADRLSAETLVAQFRRLPRVDWLRLRTDIDAAADHRL